MADIKEAGSSNRHPWEINRAYRMLKIVKKLLQHESIKIADIGAGDLFFDKLLVRNFNNVEITAVDKEFDSLESDNERISKKRDISELLSNEYDIIIMMDVLEHVENDIEFLKLVKSKLKNNKKSYLLITIPAHQKLYSNHDKFLGHYRRYERKSLLSQLEDAQLKIVDAQYFFASLYFARMLIRRFDKPIDHQQGIGGWKYSTHHPISIFINAVLRFDLFLGRIVYSLRLPWIGLSLFAICVNENYLEGLSHTIPLCLPREITSYHW